MDFHFKFFLQTALASAFVGTTFVALAQPMSTDRPNGRSFQMPGGDLFGFTSPSDVGERGDRGVAFELSNRAGKRAGRYCSATLNKQVSFTAAKNFGLAVWPWVTAHRIRD